MHQGLPWASTIALFIAMACTGGENATTAAPGDGSTTDGASRDDARASDSALVDQTNADGGDRSEVVVGSRCDGRAVQGCNGPGILCFSDVIDPLACASVIAATLADSGRSTGVPCLDFCQAMNLNWTPYASCIPAPDGGPLGTGWVRPNADGGNVSGPFVCGYIQA
jgi:hypothetical protein